MKLYTSIISALVIAGLAIFVNEFATQFDGELNACGLGEFKDGACQCVHPYVGAHCEVADCGYGRLINSLFESSLITTPNPNSEYGCMCESKFWGYSCSQCTAKYPQDCSGPCENTYFGARCDTMCKEGTASDAEGFAHAEAGGTYNFFVANHGICLNDGSVRCNPGRAGEHCEFECLDCLYGSCNLVDGTCECFQGYYGDLCNATCPGRCSGNNGVCQEDGTCDCDNGFTGADCSLDCCIRDGGTDIGRVHGECNPLGGCICDTDWSGPNCDCNDVFTCGGRGTCINDTGVCGCEPQFQGARCEMCDDLRIGPFCEYDRFQCPSKEVQNGQFVAINTRGDYACKCNAGFQGSTCETCTPSAYPKNGTEMCTFVVPASLCNRGTVKPTYQGTGIMCDCEQNFDPAQDCGACKNKYFGSDCEIFCDVLCTNSGGECTITGCKCPRGMSSVNGECVLCGGDVDCAGGECIDGRCICDPGFYGDSCSISAPIFDGKVCNGYTSVLEFETAECDTDTDCTDTEDDTLPIENQQVALRATQFGRSESTFCHRLDTPIAMKDTEGCCVDANFDGRCDEANLLEFPCSGEIVSDICNQRVLEGEVNVFQWCTSIQLGCLKNGECADPVLCEDRCDAGLNSSEWEDRWGVDHSQTMETVMNESWKFPVDFADPYTVRDFYNTASLDDVCPSGYNFCRDALIPTDATIYNATHKFVNGWQPMPSFHNCELDHHIIQNVNGTYIYNFSTPIWAGNIEMVSDPTTTAAFGRLGQGNAAYYGNVSTYIDSIKLFGRGDVELIIYNYTTDSCVDLMKRSGSHFPQCKQYAFYEFEYDWDDFCDWRDSLGTIGGFEQRCYDQSLVCAGCEDWQEGCENLPLESEYPSPMPPPCTPWDGFCEDYLNVSVRQTGTCAYTKCECEGYGVGGEACNLQCVVPRFVNSESACGGDLNPPWGQCEEHRGVMAFGMEQGECNCFNGGDPNLGCALVCQGEQDCSSDVDTPFSFTATNCSDFADVYLVEEINEEGISDPFRCHVNLRDSTCNFFRGRCECATPYTVFDKYERPVYHNMENFRVALMQGYEIDQYAPFAHYVEPGQSILTGVKKDVLCTNEFVYPVTDSFACVDSTAYKNTDRTFDEDFKRCKDYDVEDCGKTRNSTIVPQDSPCGEHILDKESCLEYGLIIPQTLSRTNEQRVIQRELGRCNTATCTPANAKCTASPTVEVVTDVPYILINSGTCQISILTSDECAAAGQMIQRGTNRIGYDTIPPVLDELFAFPSDPNALKGCYYEDGRLYFNPFGGFNDIQADSVKTSICKKSEMYLDAQALVNQLDCTGCSAIQYSERESKIFTEDASGDGYIMSDCLIFTHSVLRNQNKLYLDSGNYLIWDLNGEANVFGVELTTSLNQISPNGRTRFSDIFDLTPHVRLHGAFQNPTIRVTVYEINEDVTLDVSAVTDGTFVKDLEFELKPDRPPVLTIGGTCAGEYHAGSAFVGKRYSLKQGQGKCMDSVGALMPKLTAGDPLYSINPAEECKSRCDSVGAAGFSVQISDYSCECATSCPFALINAGFNAYTIDDVDEAEKTPAELQGNWISGNYQLQKNQKSDFQLGRCVDKNQNKGAYCTLALTKDQCYAQLSEVQACAEYVDGVCEMFCTAEGAGCCEGETVTAADASFVAPYVRSFDSVRFDAGETGRSSFLFTPDWSCLANVKPYFWISPLMCDVNVAPIGMSYNSKYFAGLPFPMNTFFPYTGPTGMDVQDFNEAFELDPIEALAMPDKISECAKRCAIEGYDEITVITKAAEHRCLCNDACTTRISTSPATWSDGTDTINYEVNSYSILDTFIEAVTDVETSCESNYAIVDSELSEFDGFVFDAKPQGNPSSYSGHRPDLFTISGEYFKVFNNEVPTLMTKKCVYKELFNFKHVKTRFVKFFVYSDQFLPHAIELRPLVTATEVVQSDGKSGCISKNNEVTYYDFMPTNISSVPRDCKYKLLATQESCDLGVLQIGTFQTNGCASHCGSAFHVKNGACYCAPFGCTLRSFDALSTAYLWGGDDCDFELLEEEHWCDNYVVGGNLDLVACADHCKSLGYTAFDAGITIDTCGCATDNCDARSASATYNTYRIKPDLEIETTFVRIIDKSCEHYGHRTIMDEEVCKRAAAEFGGSPQNIFDSLEYGRCIDALTFFPVNSVLECKASCPGAFSLKRQDTYSSASNEYCSSSNEMYTLGGTAPFDCDMYCTRDANCKYYTFNTGAPPNLCRFHPSCIPDPNGLLGYKKIDNIECGCSDECEINSGLNLDSTGFTLTPLPSGSDASPAIEITAEALIHSDLETLGTEVFHQLVDIDNDGDLDIFLTASGVFTRYFKNLGDATSPLFVEQTGADNPLDGVHCGINGASTTVGYICPFTFGDLDGDGDLDAIYTEYSNVANAEQLLYFLNTGTAESAIFQLGNFPMHTGTAVYIADYGQFGYYLLDGGGGCGSYCTPGTMVPFLVDYDGDGLMDLLTSKDYTINDPFQRVLVYKNVDGKLIQQHPTLGDTSPYDDIYHYIRSISDLDSDGSLEFHTHTGLFKKDGVSFVLDNSWYLSDVLKDGLKVFGDLNGDGVMDSAVFNTDLTFYPNYGSITKPNFHNPLWAKEECTQYCVGQGFSAGGFQMLLNNDLTVNCWCTFTYPVIPASLPYLIYAPLVFAYHSFKELPLTTRGCSMDYFTEEKVEIECTDCVCMEGDGVILPDYVTINIGTCESNGYVPIGLHAECSRAAAELGFENKLVTQWFGYATSYDQGYPLGCSYGTGLYLGDGATDCSANQICICKRAKAYTMVTGSCSSNGYYPIKTRHDCLAAQTEHLSAPITASIQMVSDNTFNGCRFDTDTYFHYPPNWVFDEGTPPAGQLFCRKSPYPANDYAIIFDDQVANGPPCAQKGFYEIMDVDQCKRAATAFGLSIMGIPPELSIYPSPNTGMVQTQANYGCNFWISGSTTVSDVGFQLCDPMRPCLCSLSAEPPTSVLPVFFALRDIVPYVSKVESKYVISDTCGNGFDEVGSKECDLAQLIFPTVETDCSNLCKHSVTECDTGEDCICHSDTPMKVFDSNESCVICGGGEMFHVESSFFNENGNTRGCIYSEETSCTTNSVGWTQYIRNYQFYGNSSDYEISLFTGYCTDSVDIPGDYDNMDISEVIDYCQRLCRQYNYFSVNRDSCKCTTNCENPDGVDQFTTFNYVTDIDPVILETAEFVEKWDEYDPNIECFKDLQHDEHVRCDWIRALKHFARGASYRVGDCHNLGPGIGEGVASQIPCSEHGFLSGGTCACDYAEQFEIKDTGIGLTFELPNLRQTPFRGKGCEVMCPGFDLWSMDSVCSGHGRCESDGRCACEQGFVGYKCHLECEQSVKALTCSGHGVCNIVEKPVSSALETLKAMNCSSEVEQMYLARDRVIEVPDGYYYMYKDSLHLVVEFYRTSVSTFVDFSAATENDFIVTIDNGPIQNDPEIRICRGTTLVKTFVGSPLSIIDSNGNFIVNSWNHTDQITVSAAAGNYVYFSNSNPELTGAFIVEDCPSFEIRNATIHDFYIQGNAFRQPYRTDIEFPYMPCQDTVSLKREEATHPLLQYTTPDVFINCSLLPGLFDGTAYKIICGECVCESSSSSGHWTGHDCRTPALGFLGEDGKTSCPGMVNEIPCNGRGTCDWGSVDGLGKQIYSNSNCFCGDTSVNANFTTAPRNEAGDLILHAMNFGIPLYQDPIAFFEGNETHCPEGTNAVNELECQYDKSGTLITLEATITTDQVYTLSREVCAAFDSSSTESITRVKATDELVIEGGDQKFKCAAACFGHYRFKAKGKIGSMLMSESLSGTFDENVETCAFMCLNKETAIDQDITTFDGFGLRGFSVSRGGSCYCEAYGAVLLDEDWRTFEYVIPYKEVSGGLCFLNNVLVYSNSDNSVKTNPGQTPAERIENCARECQAFQDQFGAVSVDAQGFSYQETDALCYCETDANDCPVQNPTTRRFDFNYFDIFRLTENTECLCGVGGGTSSTCFETLDLPGVKPDHFVLQGQTEAYEDFVCLRNNNHVCSAAKSILENFDPYCNCLDGFTGPLCETPRMMCILGGTELDGLSCDCPLPLAQNPKGCCSYGLQWNQDRYSGFSPLQVFQQISNNQFYVDALLSVCKPLDIKSFQNPGSNTDQATLALRQHNYVATTKDHKVIGPSACNNAEEASLYKAVFKFTETTTAHSDEAIDIFADDTVAYFSDHNAKMRCLDHCTINYDTSGTSRPKGFTLKTIKKAADTSAYVGEENDMPWAFRCYCNEYPAYIDQGKQTAPSFARKYKLSDTVMPTYSLRHDNQVCKFQEISSPYNGGQIMNKMKYLHGSPLGNACSPDFASLYGQAPAGATFDIRDYRTIDSGLNPLLGLRLSPDDENYNPDPKQGCAQRCARDGYDTFWIDSGFNAYPIGDPLFDDFQEVEICQCMYSEDVFVGSGNEWGWNIQNLLGAEMCSIYSTQERLESIMKTCYNAGFDTFMWNGGDGYSWAHCYMEVDCELDSQAGTKVMDISDPEIFESGESIVGDVYDIVYPKGVDNLECLQTEDRILRHVDVAGLDGTTSNDGTTNEIGVPYSLVPQILNVKTNVGLPLVGSFNLQQCVAHCGQKRDSDNRVNSFVFKPLYETIDTIYGLGISDDRLLPRCWGPCSSDSDCEAGLTCQDRDPEGMFGCRETEVEYGQYGVPGPQVIQPFQKFCGVSETQYLEQTHCQCTEHDEDFQCSRYTLRATKGYCDGFVDLGAPLNSTQPFYNIDRIAECRARCFHLDPNVRAFNVKISDRSCGCGPVYGNPNNIYAYSIPATYCHLIPDADYEAYDTAAPWGESCDKLDGFLLQTETGLYTEPVAQRFPNPLTCNIETYLDYGTIMDSSSCDCPLYDFEPMYQDTENYSLLGNYGFSANFVDTNMHYPQLKQLLGAGATLLECQQACSDQTDCVEIVHYNDGTCNGMISSALFYNNIGVADWQYKKVSDRLCDVSTSTVLSTNVLTIEECMKLVVEETNPTGGAFYWGTPRGLATDYWCGVLNVGEKTEYGYVDNYMNPTLVEKNKDDEYLCQDPVSASGTWNYVPPTGTVYEKSSVVIGVKVPTYILIQEGAYSADATATRYKKQLLESEVNRYCTIGEILEYEEAETHAHANPHYCMQECRKKINNGFILSRGNVEDGRFSCFCSQTFDEDCVLEDRSTFPQYKVYRENHGYSNTERLMSPLDPQVASTGQCKCQGYYISNGEAFSCPENTFKNSQHCTSECEKCPQGKFSTIGSTLCDLCPPGKVMNGDTCETCSAGEYATVMDTSCQICPAGKSSTVAGAGQCEACPAGWYDSDETDGLSCIPCFPGQSTKGLTNAFSCSACSKGYYSSEVASGSCTACEKGRYGNSYQETSASSCIQCGAGKYADQEGTADYCKDCLPGRATNAYARRDCMQCNTGRYQPAYGQTSCIPCDPGKYSDVKGRSYCTGCMAGKAVSSSGASSCTTCNPAYYATGVGNTICSYCPEGYYAESRMTDTCSSCTGPVPSSSMMNGKAYGESWCFAKMHGSYVRDKEKNACDSYYCGTQYTSNTGTYMTPSRDCAPGGINQMIGKPGNGVLQRRQCWTGFVSGKSATQRCNSIAMVQGDPSNSYSGYDAGGGWIWCRPSKWQQYDDTRL